MKLLEIHRSLLSHTTALSAEKDRLLKRVLELSTREARSAEGFSASVDHVASEARRLGLVVQKKRGRATGAITGFLRDAVTLAPLANAEVDIYDSAGYPLLYTYTDATGAYTGSGLSDGTYYAETLNAQGYADELYDDLPCPGAMCDASYGAPIAVAGGATTSGIDFALDAGGYISGHIESSAGSIPLAGADLRVLDHNGGFVNRCLTDGSGNCTVLTGLPTGLYYVQALAGGQYVNEIYDGVPCSFSDCNLAAATPLEVTPGATTSVNFALDYGGSISGTVTNELSQPLQGILVYAQGLSTAFTGGALTDASGFYSINGPLATDDYIVRTLVRDNNVYGRLDELYDNIPCPGGSWCSRIGATPVSVTAGSATAGINFSLGPEGIIQGNVLEAGSPPTQFPQVSVFDGSGNIVGASSPDAAGNYTVSDLASGTYYAEASSYTFIGGLYSGMNCSSCDPLSGTPIPVSQGSTTPGVDFDLNPGGQISGTVFTNPVQPVLGAANIFVFDTSGRLVSYATNDNSGFYTVPGLPTGTYYARTNRLYDFLDELYQEIPCAGGNCDPLSGTPISVSTGGTTTGIDFTLDVCPAISPAPVTLSSALEGFPYSQMVSALGGSGGYSFSLPFGYLPPGLSLDAGGMISGTPSMVGKFGFVVKAQDSNGCSGLRAYWILVGTGCLFCDDFEDGVLPSDWTFLKPAWNETGGSLVGTPSQRKAIALAVPAFAGCDVCTFEADIETTGGIGSRVWMLPWYQDRQNRVEIVMKEQENRWILKYRTGGRIVAKTKAPFTIDPGVFYHVSISYDGNLLHLSVDGGEILSLNALGLSSGSVGFQAKNTQVGIGSIAVN